MAPSRRTSFPFKLLRRYLNRYIARHFHALRVSRSGPIPELPDEPVLIVLNHPSWWDPLIGLALSERMGQDRSHHAPIESRGLAQYPILERLGFFGIEPGSTRGSLEFLRKSREILAQPGAVLWITVQGRFADCRERPPRIREGVGHLVHRISNVMVFPLALEYPFWNDRCPEALAHFGPPIRVAEGRIQSAHEWTNQIAEALRLAQDRLADKALHRDPADFDSLLGGAAGVGGVYDAWRRLRARLRGRIFVADHQVSPSPSTNASPPGNSEPGPSSFASRSPS